MNWNECPHCGSKFETHMDLNGDIDDPKENNVSICFVCKEISFFNEGLFLEKMTEEKFDELETLHPGIKEAINNAVRILKLI